MLQENQWAQRREKLIVFPAAVAKHVVHQALIQRLDNAGAVAKSMSEIVNGNRSAVPKWSAA